MGHLMNDHSTQHFNEPDLHFTSSAMRRSTQSTRIFNSQQYCSTPKVLQNHTTYSRLIHSLIHSLLLLLFPFSLFLFFFVLCFSSFDTEVSLKGRSILQPLRESWHAEFRPLKCMRCLTPLILFLIYLFFFFSVE